MLVESWPLETGLDHPEIPDSAAVWRAMFAGATRSIDLAFFYGADAPGSILGDLLRDEIEGAAARGVRVRVILDAAFYGRDPAVGERLAATPGIEVRRLDLKGRTGGVMHAKYFVVDGTDCFLGSMNLDWRSLVHIQELGLRIREPGLTAGIAELFALDWALAGGAEIEALRRPSAAPLRVDFEHQGAPHSASLVISPQGLLIDESRWDLPRLLEMIEGARSRVRLQVLSYARLGYGGERFDSLDLALRRAAARGVRVELMVADWNLRPGGVDDLKALARTRGIEVRFVTIPQASAGFIPYARVIHAKVLVVDGEAAWLGTSNAGGDYFLKSRNVGVIVRGRGFASEVEGVFEGLWRGPYARVIDPEATYAPPRIGE